MNGGYQLVVLWSDALFGLVLAAGLAYAWQAWRDPMLRDAWRRIGRSRTAVASAVILAAFASVALLDSIHLRPVLAGTQTGQGPIVSVLDLALGRLRAAQEKTYSAPLAIHLHARETVERPDGRRERVHPRLVHGGAHLGADGAGHAADIAARVARGAAFGFVLVLVPVGLFWGLGRMRGRGFGTPARAAAVTLLALGAFGGMVAELAAGYHVLGTDKVGQDVLYQSLKSIRTGLLIGTLTTLLMLPFALVLGIVAGYFGGWVDDVVQYLYTTLSSIPGVLLVAAGALLLQAYMDARPEAFNDVALRGDARLVFLCVILGVTSWTGLCRLLRAETLKLREQDFVQAARVLGVRPPVLLLRHVLPNVMHIVLITVVLDFSGLVLAEAVLSYVGIGVDPTTNSFGNMINSARLELAREPVVWWSLASAFAFLFVLVLAANLLGDAVRDALDPRHER